MNKVYILRVFSDSNNKFGDIATVVIDEGRKLSDDERLAITEKLDTVETVFVNDLASADISIMHTQGETNFAGVAVLGAAYLLRKIRGRSIKTMNSKGGDIAVSQDGELFWVRANLSAMPPWNHKQLDSAKAVELVKVVDTKDWEHTMIWAWMDEEKGLIRARTFATDWDIPEAQGNGSGSMLLAAQLNKSIEIKHGDGCLIYAKPAPNNSADIGGRVTQVPSLEV